MKESPNVLSRFLQKIEDLHNKASDTNFVWFPFQFLRPKPEEPIGLLRRLLMSLCFGLSFEVLYFLRKGIFGECPSFTSSLQSALWFCAAFFVWFTFVTSFFWNRRARRLGEQFGRIPKP